MKKLLSEYWKLIIVLAIPYLFIIISSLVKVNYDITTPATISSVSDVIQVGNKESNSVNTVSVYSYSKVNLLSYLFAKVNPYASITESYEYEVTDYKVAYSSGLIQKKVSIYNSIIAGYTAAGYDNIIDDDSFKGYIIHTLYTFSPKELKVGDIITSFNGVAFDKLSKENEFDNVTDEILFEKDKTYEITVLRKGDSIDNSYEELNFNIVSNGYYIIDDVKIAAFGINTYSYTVPNKIDIESIAYDWDYGYTIGPSGGLMQSLYVYASLTGYKNLNKLKVAGTGTVDAYGDAGAIGGIYQKIITAELSNVDVFFIPVESMVEEEYKKENNYKDAIAAYNTLKNPHIKLVVVSSLDDVIEYLDSRVFMEGE